MYTDKLIEGEDAFRGFMAKFRPGQSVEWCETIGHCFDVTVELFYERSDQEQREDKPFRCFYWLYMPSRDGKGFYHVSDRRQELHKMIREGKV